MMTTAKTLPPLDRDPVEARLAHPDEWRPPTAAELAASDALRVAVDPDDDEAAPDTPRPPWLQPTTASPTSRRRAITRARTIREAMLDHGVPQVDIRLTAGRPVYPGTDQWTACADHAVGVLSHHIASRPTVENPTPGLALVTYGRSDLPGPLCNGTAGVDLVYRIITLGLANHPGYGGPLTLTGPAGAYTVPGDNGRPYLWGTEWEGGYDVALWEREFTHQPTGRTMPYAEFMGRANAALTEAVWALNGHGHSPVRGGDYSGYHGEHSTWAPGRKIDRAGYDTTTGRAEIRRYAADTQEDDMPTPADIWTHRIPVEEGKPLMRAEVALAQARYRAGEARREAAAASRKADRAVAAARAVVTALATDDATRERGLAAVNAALDEVDDTTPSVVPDTAADDAAFAAAEAAAVPDGD